MRSSDPLFRSNRCRLGSGRGRQTRRFESASSERRAASGDSGSVLPFLTATRSSMRRPDDEEWRRVADLDQHLARRRLSAVDRGTRSGRSAPQCWILTHGFPITQRALASSSSKGSHRRCAQRSSSFVIRLIRQQRGGGLSGHRSRRFVAGPRLRDPLSSSARADEDVLPRT